MKISLLVLIVACLVFTSCKIRSEAVVKQDPESDSVIYVLNFKNDSCKVIIKEVNRSDVKSFKNSYHKEPFLGMRAECISLKDLLSVIIDVEESAIIFNDVDLGNQYYSAFIRQDVYNNIQDSMIKSKIMDALSIKIDKKINNIDTAIITLKDGGKFMQYVNTTVSDTIVSKSVISEDSFQFENFELIEILSFLSKEYDKVLILDSEEARRINIKLRKGDWELIKDKLESDLGLAFNIIKTQEVKYIVKRN